MRVGLDIVSRLGVGGKGDGTEEVTEWRRGKRGTAMGWMIAINSFSILNS